MVSSNLAKVLLLCLLVLVIGYNVKENWAASASSGNAIVSCSLCSGCQGIKKKAKKRRAACELLQSAS
jgi:hypothetical protein